MEKKLLSLKEVSSMIGKHPNTIRKWMDEGFLPWAKIGRYRMVGVEDLKIFIEKCKRVNPETARTFPDTF